MVQTFTMVLGVVLLLVGILGFVLTPTDGLILGVFAANTTHHVIHQASGISGLPRRRSDGRARSARSSARSICWSASSAS